MFNKKTVVSNFLTAPITLSIRINFSSAETPDVGSSSKEFWLETKANDISNNFLVPSDNFPAVDLQILSEN